MAIFKTDILDIELSSGSIARSFLNHTIGAGDSKANRFGVRLFRNGEPENIGGACSGYFIRADGATVVIAGGIVNGNEAYVVLPEACYAIEGQFTLAIKLIGGGATGTMRIVDGVVNRTTTDAIVDPGTLIPSIDALIEEIEDAVASIPEDYTTLSNNVTVLQGDAKNISNTQANKQRFLDAYSWVNGAVNGNDLSISTTDPLYYHFEMNITAAKMLYVEGFSYGVNYPGWIMVDSSNQVISSRAHGSSPDGYSFAETVSVPANAAKLIVNEYTNKPAGIYLFNNQDTIANDIKAQAIPVGGKYHFDQNYHIIDGPTSSQHLFCEYPVTEGIYFITGCNLSKNYPLYILLDSNDKPLVSVGTEYNQEYHDYKITVPATAVKLIVNTIKDTIMPEVKKAVATDSISAELTRDARAGELNLVSLNPSAIYGSVVKKDLSIVSTNTNYMYCTMDVIPGETYYITGRNYSVNYPMIMFTDSNDELVFSSGWTLSENTPYFDYKVIAPTDAAHIIVNSIKGADIDIKKNGTITIYKTLNDAHLSGVYMGKTPIKEVEYDLVNGAWTYNAAKAQRNLSKFGYAYATMLDRIMKTYPNARVICCNLNEAERTTSEIGFPERNAAGETVADYNHVIEVLANAFGAILVDHHSCGITLYNLDLYMYDYTSATGFGLHPNAAGMALIAEKTVKDLTGIDWTGKKVSVYGDSISTYAGTGSNPNQYPAGDVTSVNLTWWYKSLITDLGMTLLTNGSGGGRTVSTIREGIQNRPKSGCNQDAIDALAVNGTDPDVIIIKQGINDFGNVGSTGNLDLGNRYYYGGL